MGDEYVDAAIVVDIADRDAHSVSVRAESRGLSDIGKFQAARAIGVHGEIIPIQTSRAGFLRRVSGSVGTEPRSLENENVEFAVVVVVQEGDAGADDFGIIELAVPAVEMLEAHATRVGCIDEQLLRRRRLRTPGLACVRRAGPQGQRDRCRGKQSWEPHGKETKDAEFAIRIIAASYMSSADERRLASAFAQRSVLRRRAQRRRVASKTTPAIFRRGAFQSLPAASFPISSAGPAASLPRRTATPRE